MNKSLRNAVRSIPCPTCGVKEGVICRFEFASNEGRFHRKRLEAYRQTDRYKANTQKQFARIRTSVKKKKKPVNEGRNGRRKEGISGACLKGRHAQCYNERCTCTCPYCYQKIH